MSNIIIAEQSNKYDKYGSLPICYLCRNTDKIREEDCIKCLPDLVTYHCDRCEVSWDVRRPQFMSLLHRRFLHNNRRFNGSE